MQDLLEMSEDQFDELDEQAVLDAIQRERKRYDNLLEVKTGLSEGRIEIDSCATIAAALGVSRQCVDQYLHRGLYKLKRDHPKLAELLNQ